MARTLKLHLLKTVTLRIYGAYLLKRERQEPSEKVKQTTCETERHNCIPREREGS